jgi:hypothetical protein
LNPVPRTNDAPTDRDGVARTRIGRISAAITFSTPAAGGPAAAVGAPITVAAGSPLTISTIGLLRVST